MKKVFPLIAVVAFIFASCNLPSINKGEIDFTLDEGIVDKALNIAKATGGEDYPITVEVNIHGRLEKSQYKVIKSKDEAAGLNFSFDIPKNSPSDVEVLITIDKSVVLYRGVTHNVKPDDTTGPVEVALSQVFDFNEPTIRTTVNGKIVKNIRQKNFEISVVDKNGNPYPRYVKATLVYDTKNPYVDYEPIPETIILNGNESKAISFDNCFNDYLEVSEIKLEMLGNFVESKVVREAQNAYPAIYEPSGYYVLYTNRNELVLLKNIDNLSVKDDVTPLAASNIAGYSFMNGSVRALKSSFTTSNAINKNIYKVFTYTQGSEDKWEFTDEGGFNDPTTMGNNVTHSGRAYYYDIDSAIEYAFTHTQGKNMVYRYSNRRYKERFLEAVELEDNEDFSMKACVYDNKAYIMKYGTIDDPVELRVYSLDNGKRIATIDITQRYPLLYKDTSYLKALYTTDFAYDIIVQDDMVYMLYNQLGANMSTYAYSNGVSRGVLIEIDPSTNTISREFGWTGTPNGTIKCDYPDRDVRRFSPDREDSTTQFFSPLKFVALKPKKLVIADSGMFLYINDDGELTADDVSRVVEIDLETFTMTSQKSIKGNYDYSDISCFFTNLQNPAGASEIYVENPNSGSSIASYTANVRIE